MSDKKQTGKITRQLSLKMEDERNYSLRERGILFLDDEIDEGTFAKFCRDLAYLASGGSVFKESVSQGLQKPIWIVMNSPGGDVWQGFAIHDFIKALADNGVEINMVGVGVVASMATTILQSATHRYSLPHTQFLIHQVSKFTFFSDEEVNQAKENVEELERINRITLEIIANRTGMDVEELSKISFKRNCWYNPEQAKELGKNGLIDEIIIGLPFLA